MFLRNNLDPIFTDCLVILINLYPYVLLLYSITMSSLKMVYVFGANSSLQSDETEILLSISTNSMISSKNDDSYPGKIMKYIDDKINVFSNIQLVTGCQCDVSGKPIFGSFTDNMMKTIFTCNFLKEDVTGWYPTLIPDGQFSFMP